MLRIDAGRFSRRDPKKCGVKRVDIVDEAAPTGHHSAWRAGIAVVKPSRIPALFRNFGNGIDSVAQKSPEGLRAVRAARKTATHPNNRDRVLRRHMPDRNYMLKAPTTHA